MTDREALKEAVARVSAVADWIESVRGKGNAVFLPDVARDHVSDLRTILSIPAIAEALGQAEVKL